MSLASFLRIHARRVALPLLLAAPLAEPVQASAERPVLSFSIAGPDTTPGGPPGAPSDETWILPIGATTMVSITTTCTGDPGAPNCVGQLNLDIDPASEVALTAAVGGLPCFYTTAGFACIVNQQQMSSTKTYIALKVDPSSEPGTGSATLSGQGNWEPWAPIAVPLVRTVSPCPLP